MSRRIIATNDGSHTIYVESIDETYHSSHGAIQEAMHVFIEHGLKLFQHQSIRIFEMGFGTGLNALLTWLEVEKLNMNIEYFGIEAYPVEIEMISMLNYTENLSENATEMFKLLHSSEWNKGVALDDCFTLTKIQNRIESYNESKNSVDLIYYDAFGPRAQREMWELPILAKMYNMLKGDGYLVTYCANGQFKRDLKSLGFSIEVLPGPPGKREMTRARKM